MRKDGAGKRGNRRRPTERNKHERRRDLAEANQLSRHQWNWNFPVNVGVLILTMFAAAGVWAQYAKLDQTLQETRIEFQAAQRPYIEPINRPVDGNPSKMALNQALEMPLELFNYGSFPTHAYATGTIEIAERTCRAVQRRCANCLTKWFGPKSLLRVSTWSLQPRCPPKTLRI
jgi:hypothetical protein